MTTRRRLRNRYERPETEPEPVSVQPVSPFPAPPETELEPEAPPAGANGEAAESAPSPAAPKDMAPRRPARHGRFGFLFMMALALVAFITGLMVFNSLVMPRLIHGINEVEVPDVRNLTLDQAEQALRPLNLQVSRAGERFDPVVPPGFVLSQDPLPGTDVRGNRRVSVVVSLGEEFSSVPELSGESQRSAEQLLKSAGLRVGAIARAPSDDVGQDLVIGSDPGPESVLPQGSPVNLLVSTGAKEESFVMPDLMGREIGGVRRQLESLGFKVGLTGTANVGTVTAQRPAPGVRITRANEILLQATGRVIR
ncbi:MAG TPA: PASTA domain-containing protein [Candidatus Eisenbacteria bacterium]|nr:PASTA domain-containing protein [Candidatus Eisenbacteria bacterium]